jgi:hypothetical protein
MMIVSDATTWSITYDHHYGDSRGVIYFRNIFIIQATDLNDEKKFDSIDNRWPKL